MKKISDWFAGAKAGVCRNVGTKIVAMVAAVAMLGGVAGVSMTAMAEEGQTPDVQTTQQATPTTDTATTNDDASADGAATGSLLVDETFKNSTFSDPSKWSTKDGACLTANGCSNTMDTSDIQRILLTFSRRAMARATCSSRMAPQAKRVPCCTIRRSRLAMVWTSPLITTCMAVMRLTATMAMASASS